MAQRYTHSIPDDIVEHKPGLERLIEWGKVSEI